MKHLLPLFFALLAIFEVAAHPMPNSLVDLRIRPKGLVFDVQMPLSDFETVLGEKADPNALEKIEAYFRKHLSVESPGDGFWKFEIEKANLLETSDAFIGHYTEIRVVLNAFPPKEGLNPRKFVLFYDAILHQIVTHQAIINIRQDWENGINEQAKELAVLKMDTESGKVYPISVSLENGSIGKGVKAMLALGMDHILKGTDHLLFLLMLLLVAPLTLSEGKWSRFSGLRYSLIRLLKMVTAFTLGHSITLAICSLGWLHFSSQWVEIVVALSILVSALHVIFPLFYGKEMLIASLFGLVHGMAFSNTLSALQLDKSQLLFSILGFNLGIELVQVLLVACSIPFLLYMSKTFYYVYFKNAAALLGMIAATGWMAQRISGVGNPISAITDNWTNHSYAIFGILCALSLLCLSLEMAVKRQQTTQGQA